MTEKETADRKTVLMLQARILVLEQKVEELEKVLLVEVPYLSKVMIVGEEK